MAIGFVCATSAKYDQTATLLRQGYTADSEKQGEYVTRVHPITGEVIREWVESEPDPDNPGQFATVEFKCQARSIITGGLNSQGTTERWTTKGTYENVDIIEIYFPKDVTITARDRVTNIRDSAGKVIWNEPDWRGVLKPTVFDVRGVSPSLDPFGHVIEYFAMLERSEIQSESGVEGTNG